MNEDIDRLYIKTSIREQIKPSLYATGCTGCTRYLKLLLELLKHTQEIESNLQCKYKTYLKFKFGFKLILTNK